MSLSRGGLGRREYDGKVRRPAVSAIKDNAFVDWSIIDKRKHFIILP